MSGSARAIRFSSSRTPDRYWSSFCLSLPPSLRFRSLASSRTESSTLARSSFRATASGSLGRSANRRSKTCLGFTSGGTGVVASRHDSVCS